jgi:uroporphyrinogen-III decarboxylase
MCTWGETVKEECFSWNKTKRKKLCKCKHHRRYDVIQVDWTIDPAEARRRVGPHKTLQGNLDPCVLYGSDETIRDEVEKMITGFGTQR